MSNQDNNIAFALLGIEEKEYATFLQDKIEEKEIQESIGFGFGADVESNVIACSCHYILESNNTPFIKIVIRCVYKIDKKSWLDFLQDSPKLILPNDFACHLAAITASTTRGVLFANTKGSALNKYFMRLMDVKKIVGNRSVEIDF